METEEAAAAEEEGEAAGVVAADVEDDEQTKEFIKELKLDEYDDEPEGM